ncbi:MAG: hypothetical protein FWH22_00155 [Fibromonadales bacterium]|nr:hypothetical protein [Fibromonadales bacterium]
MKKIALFVEGQTEQLFAVELIRQIFDRRKIAIESTHFTGKIGARKITIIQSTIATQKTAYYFRIYDCRGGGDNSTVKSDVVDQLASLGREGFSSVIGIRDVYPLTDIALLRKMLRYGIPKTNIPINIVLAVREIEAWFIAEETHYEKLSPLLSIKVANAVTGIDLQKDSTESLEHPAEILHEIYHRAELAYRKRKRHVERTVEALDYENLYLNVRNRNSSLNELLDCLDGLLR